MMKKDYQTPESRIRLFQTKDVIMTSSEEIQLDPNQTEILLELEA